MRRVLGLIRDAAPGAAAGWRNSLRMTNIAKGPLADVTPAILARLIRVARHIVRGRAGGEAQLAAREALEALKRRRRARLHELRAVRRQMVDTGVLGRQPRARA